MVNQVALASLPENFPAFVRTPAAQERVAFLAGEPDRWRNNTNHMGLSHCNEPDHFLDLEQLAWSGLTPQTMSHLRHEFAGQVYLARAQHPNNFPPLEEKRNHAHQHELPGVLPIALNEYYGKLQSTFSYLKTLETSGGTPEEISNAQQNALYIMGVMGHFAGDSSQPLHTTIHHHGWAVGVANPHHYATNSSIHGWIDGGYIHKTGINFAEMKPRVRPAKLIFGITSESHPSDVFSPIMEFILAQNKLVEPLYQLNQDKSLSDDGGPGSKGRAFITQQLLAGGQLLGDLWFSAWQTAPEDKYLKGELKKRNTPPGEKTSTRKPRKPRKK